LLEVLSKSSIARDTAEKRQTYDLLGAREYALFAPTPGLLSPPLQGFRRDAAGAFVPWLPDAEGRLWSEVLDLYLVAEGTMVRARQRDGSPLLTPEQEAAGHQREAAARHQAEQRADQEAAARRRAEEELARLREEVDRLRGGNSSAGS
jgi:hypothetical protein